MYLKQIEMQGFKSFPDRTRLVFEPGSTVIIGPNGSGKSNISDAMRWVLGEISYKTLRGSKMEDIIFGGSDSRKPMGFAEVSVTFDNRSEHGKLDYPADDVTVTRRYYRNGDSEYYVNKKSVRLRDVYELFLNTGIGRDGYSIIGQGRITEMISRKSDERRGIFEDAAGIAKYRHRKNEAERRLAATRDNMERVRDIVDVIGERLVTLERESIKAKRYLEYSEIKRKADVRLWLYDTDNMRTEVAQAEQTLRETSRELSEASEALETLLAKQDRLDELSVKNKAESARLVEEMRVRTRENYELDSSIKVAQTKLAHLEATAAGEREKARNDVAEATAEAKRAEEKRAEGASLAAEADELARRDAEIKSKAEKAEERSRLLKEAVADAFDKLSASKAELSDVNARLELLGRTENEDHGRDEAAKREINDRQALAEQHLSECRESELTIAQYGERIAARAEEAGELSSRLLELQEVLGKAEKSLAEYSVRSETLTGKIDALRRMEEHFDGYNNSVRHVMRAYKEGGIGGRIPCGTIYGPLSSLIKVESRYVTAIETALGAAIQNIVVDNENTARAAIECLKRDSAGRATFFPLTSVRPRTPYGDDVRRAGTFAGYVGVAAELVAADPAFDNIIHSMLGRIVVFDTLENAVKMSQSVKYGLRVVTLDGQQINRDGSFTGGSVRTGSGILTRADEIARMSSELEKLRGASAELEKREATLRREVSEVGERLESVKNEEKLLETLRAVESAKLEKQKETVASDRELLEKLAADLQNVTGEIERREHEVELLEAKKRELVVRISETEAFRAERENERGALLNECDLLRGESLKLTVRISELRRDVESRRALADISDDKVRALRSEANACLTRAENCEKEAAALSSELADELEKHIKGEAELGQINDKRRSVDDGGLELERKLNDIRRVIKERQARKDTLVQSATRKEAMLEQLKEKLDSLMKKFWEEHELTRAQALEFGYPALTAAERPAEIALQTEYRNKIRNIGSTNPAAIEEYQTEKEKYDKLTEQLKDLDASGNELEKLISRLESEMKTAFSESFDKINENFGKTFCELFGGGSAQLILTDPDDVLESGIEIKAAPPGKIIKSLMQLSGGEQAFVGVALFFAILRVNPTPFCILDEIEAALDEVNVERLAQYIRKYSEETQFIIITHRRGTMNAANRLYGVTMPESGISKILTVDVADVSDKKGNGELWNELSR